MSRLRYLLICIWPALCLLAGGARGAIVIWSDNFETNASGYWNPSVSSVWRVGSPAGGPPINGLGNRTHSGANCAYTGNYKANTDARLICNAYNGKTTLLIPTNSVQPRLRFWHWFNIQNALGFVEISTNNGGTWDQISPTYESITGSGVWSRPSIDLTPYTGMRVMFALRFFGSGTGNGLGWYVDDVEVDSGAQNEGFPENFEFDPKFSDWSMDYGTWEIGYPTSGPGRAHSGTNCAATVLGGNYANYVNSRLISPWFVVPANATLTFWHWYSFNNAVGFVEVNDGSQVTSCTTQTVTTNSLVPMGMNTNIYVFTNGVTNPFYTNQFVYNVNSGQWTNGNRVLGLGYPSPVYGPFPGNQFYFEAGIPPLPLSPFQFGVVDYICLSNGVPQQAIATNFIAAMQGMIWTNVLGNPYTNVLIGCFGTNYVLTNSTYTVTNCTSSSWNQVSPTWENGTTAGAWTNVAVDLSAYAGHMVQLAFHFGSVASPAPGWYVDDLTLVVPPQLILPDTPVIVEAGLNLTNLPVIISAANPYVPNAVFKYALLSAPAGLTVNSNTGVVAWQTSLNQPASTNTITVKVTDNTQPPLGSTNSFVVIVDNPLVFITVPSATNIYAGQLLTVSNTAVNNNSPGDVFTFSLLSTLLTNMDISDLATNGNLSWPTMTTQKPGVYTITIGVIDSTQNTGATNSFKVTVMPATKPTLKLPGPQSIFEGQTLMISNIYATNIAFPDAVYAYMLSNSPADANLTTEPDNTATVAWATTATNKSMARNFTVLAADDNTPPLTVSGSFTVNVLPTPAPVLTVPTKAVTNYPGQQLSVALFVTNVARPDAMYTFGLPSPSTNVMVTNNDIATAVLTWTNTGLMNNILTWTNNSVAPGSKTIYVLAQDNDWPSGLVTNHFTIVFVPPKPPHLAPPNITIYVGQTFTNAIGATNDWLPGTNFIFTLLAASTNGLIKSNMLAWTNYNLLPGVYGLSVKVTDTSVPPLKNTNSLVITVGPPPSQLNLTNLQFGAATGHKFKFTIATPWTNTPWRIEANNNLGAAGNWQPIFTNHGGASGGIIFTDALSTNFPQRYYRAVFP